MTLLKANGIGLYVLESYATTNDNWIADHTGDPGEADLSVYEEGLEFIHIADVLKIESSGSANYESDSTYMGWRVKGIGKGKKDYYTYGDDKHAITVLGEVDLTHLDYLQRAFKEFNISRATPTLVKKYLVWQYDTDIYKNWYDEDGDEHDYCPVIWRGFDWSKPMDTSVAAGLFGVMLAFEVVWD